MHKYQFLIFFSIVILIYGSVNYYIYRHLAMALPPDKGVAGWFRWGFVFLASSYVIGRFLERIWLSPVSDFFTWTGSFWLALMTYGLLAVVLIDLVRFINWVVPVLPQWLSNPPEGTKKLIAIVITGVIVLIVAAGYINFLTPRIKQLDIAIDKNAGERKTLSIVMASDIHMGTLIGPNRTRKMVEMINSLNPDIVLFAGDLVDEDLAPVIRHDLGKSLKQLKSNYGVYAITGNHEYIGGVKPAVKYLEEHGITVLKDTVNLIDSSFYVAGRIDRDSRRFAGTFRKPVAEIVKEIDSKLPLILMDHQPFNLGEAREAGVDLQLSGHTHHGQLWPFNYITDAIYELGYGYRKTGSTHYYVSCGFGGWGPPVRTNSRPEIVNIKITFRDPQ